MNGIPGQLTSPIEHIKRNNHKPNQNQHETTYTKFLLTGTYKPELNFTRNSLIQIDLWHKLMKSIHSWINRAVCTPLVTTLPSMKHAESFCKTLSRHHLLLNYLKSLNLLLWLQTWQIRLPFGDSFQGICKE